VLLNDLVKGNVLPLIGSGFSRNAEGLSEEIIPLWNELGELVANKIGTYEYNNNDPIAAISEFVKQYRKSKLVEYLCEFLHVGKARPGKLTLC
jgi:hypothetical protein